MIRLICLLLLTAIALRPGSAFCAEADSGSAEVTRTVGDVTLHIPQGYINTRDGYQGPMGYVNIHALLPCLVPEGSNNSSEFHQNTRGNVLTAILRV